MNRANTIFVTSVTLATLWACNGPTPTADGTSTSAAPKTTDTAASTATVEATAAPSATASATAAPETSASADASSTAAAKQPPSPASAAPAASGSAAAGGKKYDCGSKGQKACPMQGWMKGVMARAMASGDGDKIAKALNTIASKPVPGMGSWSAIAAGGAAKAKAGDIDGAKASCKKCHSLYQKKYVTTMRDQPW